MRQRIGKITCSQYVSIVLLSKNSVDRDDFSYTDSTEGIRPAGIFDEVRPIRVLIVWLRLEAALCLGEFIPWLSDQVMLVRKMRGGGA